ncbi:TolB family protein [Miltoncostaea oceani]|uniref:TolB family protein n=1 Tax=Miltoncostaea oceani TaxID=2843216 RepID=UPI001C3D11F2|nr:hypothetical protein [Miltoncostaea oceani]
MRRRGLTPRGAVALVAIVGAGAVAAPAVAVKDDLEMVSRTSTGVGANGDSTTADISSDGRIVVFQSVAANLSDADDDTAVDVYARDMRTGVTTLVSRATGAAGAGGDDDSSDPSISADGRYVVFESTADNLSAEDDDTATNVFVRDLTANTTTLVSRATGLLSAAADASSFDAAISANGRVVAFTSAADNLAGDDDDTVQNVHVRDLVTGTTTFVSRATGAGAPGDGDSRTPAISADGRYVAFNSAADNLSTEDDDAVQDVFVRDVLTNTTTYVSRATGAAGAPADAISLAPDISGDGRLVAFQSSADNLSAEDDDTVEDVYLRDLAAGTTTLLSRGAGAGPAGDGPSAAPVISNDGRHVAYSSAADNLGVGDGPADDVFSRDLQTGAVSYVSRGGGPAGPPGNGPSSAPAISSDGRYVAFHTVAENLAPVMGIDLNVFRRDVLGPTAAATTPANLCAAVPAPAPPAARPPGRVRLTRQQMRIDQRIGQAAIRRLAAIQAWLDAGIAARDICGGAIGPADLATGIVAEPRVGRLAILSAATPRPITPATPRPGGRAVFRLTQGQLLTNQRIYQAAVRRANGLRARLDAGLTGGDVIDGAVTQGRLHDRLAIVLAPAGTPVPPSVTVVAPPGTGRPGAVELSAKQLRINQKVAQAAVRRANALTAELSAGLDGADFRDGTIGAADLAPGIVAP